MAFVASRLRELAADETVLFDLEPPTPPPEPPKEEEEVRARGSNLARPEGGQQTLVSAPPTPPSQPQEVIEAGWSRLGRLGTERGV